MQYEWRIGKHIFTAGNVHDNKVLKEVLEDISGVFVCDSGYLLKTEDLDSFVSRNKEFFYLYKKEHEKADDGRTKTIIQEKKHN